jgi:hypothetical protein
MEVGAKGIKEIYTITAVKKGIEQFVSLALLRVLLCDLLWLNELMFTTKVIL